MTEKEEIQTELDRQAMQDITELLATANGRRFFMWLFDQCGYNSTSFTRDSRTYFNEGRRDVALMLRSCILTRGFTNLTLMHKAEAEFIKFKDTIRRQLKESNDKK